jgi:hypothetical protein
MSFKLIARNFLQRITFVELIVGSMMVTAMAFPPIYFGLGPGFETRHARFNQLAEPLQVVLQKNGYSHIECSGSGLSKVWKDGEMRYVDGLCIPAGNFGSGDLHVTPNDVYFSFYEGETKDIQLAYFERAMVLMSEDLLVLDNAAKIEIAYWKKFLEKQKTANDLRWSEK